MRSKTIKLKGRDTQIDKQHRQAKMPATGGNTGISAVPRPVVKNAAHLNKFIVGRPKNNKTKYIMKG